MKKHEYYYEIIRSVSLRLAEEARDDMRSQINDGWGISKFFDLDSVDLKEYGIFSEPHERMKNMRHIEGLENENRELHHQVMLLSASLNREKTTKGGKVALNDGDFLKLRNFAGFINELLDRRNFIKEESEA